MYKREMGPILENLATKYPAVVILGPRQSGKTTLAKLTFPKHVYLTLEDRATRERAAVDPKGFFESYRNAPGIILDEFQNLPELLSYIQIIIDEQYRPGYFILTGSQNFLMMSSVSQSLAGRVGILTLLPMSISEFKLNNLLPAQADKSIFYGGYPRIYYQNFDPVVWYSDYIETYVEKDIRQIMKLSDINLFRKFVSLCAGRIGQTLSLTSLSNDCGISLPTVKSWLSLLESSYIIFLLQPYYENLGKRVMKSPKLYFYDTGLACSLLSINSELQLSTHYLRGGLFESFIISDLFKQFYNKGHRPKIYFWQESHRSEIDCLVFKEDKIIPVEIKAGQTINQDFFKGLEMWAELTGTKPFDRYIVYGGPEDQTWPKAQVISWQNISDFI